MKQQYLRLSQLVLVARDSWFVYSVALALFGLQFLELLAFPNYLAVSEVLQFA